MGLAAHDPSALAKYPGRGSASVSDSVANLEGVAERAGGIVAHQAVWASADAHPSVPEDPVNPLDLVALMDSVVLGSGDAALVRLLRWSSPLEFSLAAHAQPPADRSEGGR